MGQARLIDSQTGGRDPPDQFVAQPRGDVLSVGPQGHFGIGPLLPMVVGIV